MPLNSSVKKVLVIGSGPIIIGQAAEFDYAGTQACKALKEEGLEVVLVNSNPATIMTDTNIADKVYLEPLNVETIEKIIARERPDSLLPTLGGQTGLNLAVELAEAGILKRYNVSLLGTNLDSIKKAEDRELFKETMLAIGEPVPESTIVSCAQDAIVFAKQIGFPVIVRPAYTLGGTGGGIVKNLRELAEIADKGIKASMVGQILLERSVAGWKEIEYEVMRDSYDNCITVCNMENFDPVGVHTGDSIVVAPSQTLADKEHQMLRTAALKIIRALKVEGGCNVQLALDPFSDQYVVIEVNPRVSRSSALASKATGYPIAKMAAKIAVGLSLAEITNPVTGKTTACFEPTIDYCVVKIPRWPFDKFATGDRILGTQMKATGEVMAIERSFEAALQKAVRSLEIGVMGLRLPEAAQWTDMELEDKLLHGDDERLFAIAEAFRRDWTLREIYLSTKVDIWFLEKVRNIIRFEEELKASALNSKLLLKAKRLGFSDYTIAKLKGMSAEDIRNLRKEKNIASVYKTVDTCAAEFEAETPYYYSVYETENESLPSDKEKVVVLGSGPIRIGQGVEFDYCSVHAVWALKEAGKEAIIVNNNPETVSTDFDTSDKLYFEPLTIEDVRNVIDLEKPEGVVVQFGGQTAINLAEGLAEHGVPILGTAVEDIDAAEDRKKFERLLRELGIPQSEGRSAEKPEEAISIAQELGFPVLVRPSYVIGGRAMEVVGNVEDLQNYLRTAVKVSPKHPILVDKYIRGREVEVDAVCDGERVLIPTIMEHIERAGVHSGDSLAVFPPRSLTKAEIKQLVNYTRKIALALKVKGLLNIQFVVAGGVVYCIEVNPRASRTVPIISKVTGIPLVNLATKIQIGMKLTDLGYEDGLAPQIPFYTVKAPVFSFEKLIAVDIALGPEMKSTGEVMGVDENYEAALLKAMQAAGIKFKSEGTIFLAAADKDKKEIIPLAKDFAKMGFQLKASNDTALLLLSEGLKCGICDISNGGLENMLDSIKRGEIQLVVNTPTKGKIPTRNGFKIRRAAAEYRVTCLTSLDTAYAYLVAAAWLREEKPVLTKALQDYFCEENQMRVVSEVS